MVDATLTLPQAASPAMRERVRFEPSTCSIGAELFEHVAAGRIRIEINQRYELQDAAQAHRDLETRKTTGSSIFVV